MRLFYFSNVVTISLCFVLWPLFQAGSAVLCLNLPDSAFRPDAFFFCSHSWEKNGQLYETLFAVKRWKHLLPDGGAVWKKKGYQKKRLTDFSEQNLNRFLVESARGEFSHWLAILPFWVFGLFAPPEVIAAEARKVLDDFHAAGPGGGHVFNLGHGISQFTPPEHVTALVSTVHDYSRQLRQKVG